MWTNALQNRYAASCISGLTVLTLTRNGGTAPRSGYVRVGRWVLLVRVGCSDRSECKEAVSSAVSSSSSPILGAGIAYPGMSSLLVGLRTRFDKLE